MSSEAITRNDLENILNETFPPKYPASNISATDGSGNITNVQTLLNKLNLTYRTESTESASVGANSSKWFELALPADAICAVGYYINGNGGRFRPYAFRTSEDKAQLAIQNTTSTATTCSIDFTFLCWGTV